MGGASTLRSFRCGMVMCKYIAIICKSRSPGSMLIGNPVIKPPQALILTTNHPTTLANIQGCLVNGNKYSNFKLIYVQII